MRPCLLFLKLLGPLSLSASEIWVDGDLGDDANAGSRAEPLASIGAGIQRLAPGMTLHVLPRKEPWPIGVRIEADGAEEAPITIDGHGSLLSGRTEVPLSEWKPEGGGIFSRPLPNNAWGMATCWEGGFPLVWIDGEAGQNVRSREALAPGCYFLYKNQAESREDPLHNTLYLCPPEGANRIETIVGEGGIYVGGDHVILKRFVVEYGGRDGFATHRNRGVVFEDVEARFFMDQGMSHHGAEVTVRGAHFHHNAGAGVVDVYPESKTHYENCLIENDTWRGGVEFHKGVFSMVNCVIRGNPNTALTVTKGARVTLRNCVIERGEGRGDTGVKLSEGSSLEMEKCTLRDFRNGLVATIDASTLLSIETSSFSRCGLTLGVTACERLAMPTFQLPDRLALGGNEFGGGLFELTRKIQLPERWKVATEGFEFERRPVFFEKLGAPDAEGGADAGADEDRLREVIE